MNLRPALEGELTSLRRLRMLKHDSIGCGSSDASQRRLARLEPNQGDQTEPALRQSQLGVPCTGPFSMFLEKSGHGDIRRFSFA